MAASRLFFNRCGSGMVFTACLGAAFAPGNESLAYRECPAKTVPNFDPSVFQLSYGCEIVATRVAENPWA
jgi:hypothetical protein